MRRNPITALLLALFVFELLCVPKPKAHAAEAEQASILLVYDRLAAGTAKEGNVEAMLKLLSAMGAGVKLMPVERYEPGLLRNFERLIVVRNSPELKLRNEGFERELASYSGAYLHIGDDPSAVIESGLQLQISALKARVVSLSIGPIRQAELPVRGMQISIAAHYAGEMYGYVEAKELRQPAPFGIKNGRLAAVPYFEAGAAAELAMAYVLKAWLGANVDGQAYALFKEIYPFTDLGALQAAADRLYDLGIPFIYSVRPVFANTDYPAMQRYLELLKYAQSRNGAILVNAPVISPVAGNQEDSLRDKMAGFIDLLAEHRIVPLGIGADMDMYWRNERNFMREGMPFFDSSVLFPGESPVNVTEGESTSFASSMLSLRWRDVEPLLNERWLVEPLPLHLAVTFDFPEDAAGADAVLEALKGGWLSFSDYKTLPHTTKTESHVLKSENGQLMKDGQAVNLNAAVSVVSADYEYREKEKESFKRFFTVQNNIYLVVIGIALLLFSGLFAAGFRLYRRKFKK
ncbi:hypothetical protein D3P08_25435 [Paenibacillus nanensis]|uniref:DUF2334 domain-containing protein n=1 Tax=Paenibacillus nanensis TaxID=393251 RepID=A0A3A1UKP7_9BACL|nr:hypothetical protein [Paenibacillus nanensis]RIX47258.1 hypothetical protein D3P08_25435 [Paenibacillus nanensis]